jgi:tripartite-type tricarboxylate transporter receptor subunit TctC
MDVTPPILGDPGLRFNYQDFVVIAGVSQVSVAIGRTDIQPGMTRAADIAKATEIIAGGYGPTSDVTMRMRLLLETMNVKYRIIFGYRSAGDLMTALMRNELNFLILSMSGFLTQADANIIKTGMGLPFWYLPRSVSVDGGYKKSELLEARGVRAFSSFYRDAFGKMPSGIQWETFVFLQNLTSSLRRVVVMPPNSPDAAVSEMRRAFAALGEDQNFVAEYEKVVGESPELVSAQEAQTILGQLRQVKPELIAVIKNTLDKR